MFARARMKSVAAAIALPLTLWSAVPSVQRCAYAWSEVGLECFLPRARAATCVPPAAVDAGTACEAAVACEAPAGCRTACGDVGACSAPGEPARAPVADGERAWCLGDPVGGIGIAHDLTDDHAAIRERIDPIDRPAPATRFPRVLQQTRPPAPPGRDRPPIRAPPIA